MNGSYESFLPPSGAVEKQTHRMIPILRVYLIARHAWGISQSPLTMSFDNTGSILDAVVEASGKRRTTKGRRAHSPVDRERVRYRKIQIYISVCVYIYMCITRVHIGVSLSKGS